MAPSNSQYTQPVILSGSVTVNPGSDGIIPATAIANPLNVPLELLELRIRLWPQAGYGGKPGNTGATGSTVSGLGLGIKLDVGKVPIVDAYTPIGVFGSSRDSHGDLAELRLTPLALPVGTSAPPTMFQWRLKYPMYMPVGVLPSMVVRPLGQNAFPVQVDLAYVCRTWDHSKPNPLKVRVPWACSWETKTFDYNSGVAATTDKSSSLEIYNPFSSTLEVARIGGRLSKLSGGALGNSFESLTEDISLFRYVNTKFTMRSSRGFDLIRTPVPFGGMFPYSWRCWDMANPWFMAPREFYSVAVQAAANTDASGLIAQFQYSIGLTGYRQVPVAALVEV